MDIFIVMSIVLVLLFFALIVARVLEMKKEERLFYSQKNNSLSIKANDCEFKDEALFVGNGTEKKINKSMTGSARLYLGKYKTKMDVEKYEEMVEKLSNE